MKERKRLREREREREIEGRMDLVIKNNTKKYKLYERKLVTVRE